MPAGVCAVRGPAARGLLALGTLSGGVLLADPRKGYSVEHTLAAHASGLADLDARGDLLATCGYGLRHGQVVSDLHVKVGCQGFIPLPCWGLSTPLLHAPRLGTRLCVTGGSLSSCDRAHPCLVDAPRPAFPVFPPH